MADYRTETLSAQDVSENFIHWLLTQRSCLAVSKPNIVALIFQVQGVISPSEERPLSPVMAEKAKSPCIARIVAPEIGCLSDFTIPIRACETA